MAPHDPAFAPQGTPIVGSFRDSGRALLTMPKEFFWRCPVLFYRLCYSMWLFHLHSAVKIRPFYPVFPLAGSTDKAFAGYPFGTSGKKASTIFYNTAFSLHSEPYTAAVGREASANLTRHDEQEADTSPAPERAGQARQAPGTDEQQGVRRYAEEQDRRMLSVARWRTAIVPTTVVTGSSAFEG